MRDNISCEEVFEADPKARAEFDAVCSEWQNEAVIAQDKAKGCECDICADTETCWCKPFESCSMCFGKA